MRFRHRREGYAILVGGLLWILLCVRMLGRELIIFIVGVFYRIQLQEEQSAKGLEHIFLCLLER